MVLTRCEIVSRRRAVPRPACRRGAPGREKGSSRKKEEVKEFPCLRALVSRGTGVDLLFPCNLDTRYKHLKTKDFSSKTLIRCG